MYRRAQLFNFPYGNRCEWCISVSGVFTSSSVLPERSQTQRCPGCRWKRLLVAVCGPELGWCGALASGTGAHKWPSPEPPPQSLPEHTQVQKIKFKWAHQTITTTKHTYIIPLTHLLLGLCLLHILAAHFDAGSENCSTELQHTDAQQVAQFLCSCIVRHRRLVRVLLLLKADVPKLQHGRDHLQHGWEAKIGIR